MTAGQRGLLVRTLKRVSLALLVAGILAGAYVCYDVRGPSPAEQLRFLEAREKTGALYPSDLPELADLRARREMGRLSARRPIGFDDAFAFMFGAVPFLLLSGII